MNHNIEHTSSAAVEQSVADRVDQPSGEAGAQSLERALRILVAFRRETPIRKVSDVGRELGLPKSTTSRLFRALAVGGFLQRVDGGTGYRLGPTVFDLGARYLAGIDLHTVARDTLQELAAVEGESVNLGVLEGTDAISIVVVQGSRAPQLVSRLGRRIPVWCSAAGKALLADEEVDDVRRMLATVDWAPRTAHTITDPDRFMAELALTQQRGWAFNDEESELGLRVVAAPVRDHRGAVVASISVSGPIFRLDDQRVGELGVAAAAAAASVSRLLGHGVAPEWG